MIEMKWVIKCNNCPHSDYIEEEGASDLEEAADIFAHDGWLADPKGGPCLCIDCWETKLQKEQDDG